MNQSHPPSSGTRLHIASISCGYPGPPVSPGGSLGGLFGRRRLLSSSGLHRRCPLSEYSLRVDAFDGGEDGNVVRYAKSSPSRSKLESTVRVSRLELLPVTGETTKQASTSAPTDRDSPRVAWFAIGELFPRTVTSWSWPFESPRGQWHALHT